MASLGTSKVNVTDVITHWTRPEGPYAGDIETLERDAADVIPGLRS